MGYDQEKINPYKKGVEKNAAGRADVRQYCSYLR